MNISKRTINGKPWHVSYYWLRHENQQVANRLNSTRLQRQLLKQTNELNERDE